MEEDLKEQEIGEGKEKKEQDPSFGFDVTLLVATLGKCIAARRV